MTVPSPVTTSQLARVLEAASLSTIVVVGDVMLDEYLVGEVERTSPEAPVPVLRVQERTAGLGGAANVARQLAHFGAHVELAGAVGPDRSGERLRDLCAGASIATDHLMVLPERTTTRKQRAVAGRQQVLRIDREDPTPLRDDQVEDLLDRLAASPAPAAIVVSDYAKGVVTPRLMDGVVDLAATWGVPLLVDPKRADFDLYRGATLVKANRVEFEAAVGQKLGEVPEQDLVEPARLLCKQSGLGHLVVTLGAHGMVVVSGDDAPTVVAQHVEEVFDVSGAGDTVIALLALAMVAGEDLPAAAAIANEAAGVVVRKTGVAVCEPGDLVARMRRLPAGSSASTDAIAAQVATWRSAGRTVVFTNGCFDLLHPGHLHLLRSAAAEGDALVVGVNSDRSIRSLKGPERPYIAEAERVAMLEALSCVDAVVVFDEPDPRRLIEALVPDVLVKGADYELADIVGRDLVEASGGRVLTMGLLPGWSTTSLLGRIQDGIPQR